jgi:dienelactone hydrolase
VELLKSILAKSPVSWKVEVIEGGDHCFNLPKSMGIGKSEVFDRIVKTAVQWMQANFNRILY